jgi:hypothetical protein
MQKTFLKVCFPLELHNCILCTMFWQVQNSEMETEKKLLLD